MDVRLTIIICVISLTPWIPSGSTEDDPSLLSAQVTLMNSGIGIDLEESHIGDLKTHDNLPAAYQRVIDSLHVEAETCDPSEKYRRADGVCNRLSSPLDGAVLHYQRRLLPNAYMDGMSIPRMTGENDNYLASARTVSVNCFPPNKETKKFLDRKTTQMSMQWGQYIDHDLVFTEVMTGSGCCKDPRHTCVHPDTFTGNTSCARGPCFPIVIPEGDRYFNETCMAFKRSFSINVEDVHEQISGVTAFVDASTVYGSNEALQDQLRKHEGGLLKVTDQNMLPNQGPYKCRRHIVQATHCPHAGDSRVNVFPGLTSVHLLFVREHNRLAQKLSKLNAHWDDERIFQEAKRIIIALHQKITYEEFLPHVIGDAAMTFFRLKAGDYEYNPDINPGILNEFAVAAFRYGHSQINAFLNTDKNKPISDIFFQPWEAQKSEKTLKRVMKDQCKKQAQRTNQFLTTQVTDLLFLDVDAPGHSTDLGARNVQRGRDHGIPPYLKYLDLAINNFLKPGKVPYDHIRLPSCVNSKAYDSVNDVDLFVGGLHETPMEGALVGPTFAYIIGEQFRRLKFGDRFFFETDDPVVGFTQDQLKEVKKLSFAHVLCQNTKIINMQPDVFSIDNNNTNKLKPCSDYQDIDLSSWKESTEAL